MMTNIWDIARKRFEALSHLAFFDSGSYGVQSNGTRDAIVDYTRLLSDQAPTSKDGMVFWENGRLSTRNAATYKSLSIWKGVEELRETCAKILGCDHKSIHWRANTTDAFEAIVSLVHWEKEDKLVTTDLEHDSILNVCEKLQRRERINIEQVPARELVSHVDFEIRLKDRLAQHVDEHTRLVLFSHIFFSCGLAVDPRPIVDRIRRKSPNALVVVDGAHSLGQIPLNLDSYGCDAYITSGSKWLLAPGGTGILYVPEWKESMVWPTEQYESSKDSVSSVRRRQLKYTRGDTSDLVLGLSPPYGLIGLKNAAAEYLELGPNEVWSKIQTNVREAREILKSVRGIHLEPDNGVPSGMLFARMKDWTAKDAKVVEDQLKTLAIITQAIETPPSIRICLHYFNNGDDAKQLAEAMHRLL